MGNLPTELFATDKRFLEKRGNTWKWWKRQLCPIYEKGGQQMCNNYRAIVVIITLQWHLQNIVKLHVRYRVRPWIKELLDDNTGQIFWLFF